MAQQRSTIASPQSSSKSFYLSKDGAADRFVCSFTLPFPSDKDPDAFIGKYNGTVIDRFAVSVKRLPETIPAASAVIGIELSSEVPADAAIATIGMDGQQQTGAQRMLLPYELRVSLKRAAERIFMHQLGLEKITPWIQNIGHR